MTNTTTIAPLVLPPAPPALSIYIPHSPAARRAHAVRFQAWKDECYRLTQAHKHAVEEAAKPKVPTEDDIYQLQLLEYQRQQDAALQRQIADEMARQQHQDYLDSTPVVVDVSSNNPATFILEVQHRTRQGYVLLPHTAEVLGLGLLIAKFELMQPVKRSK